MIIDDGIDVKLLKEFLLKIDSRLPVALSERVNLDAYAQKVCSVGRVIGIVEEDKLVAAILFYANDLKEKKAYLTLLGTLEGYEGRGYARELMEKAEESSKAIGMKSVHLDTERSNRKAIDFYERRGYLINSITENRVHMLKEI